MKPGFGEGYLKSQDVMSRMCSGMMMSKHRQDVEAAIGKNLKELGYGK
jgi:hypothetical protein